MPSAKQILSKLKKLENKKNKEGMARFGINTENAYGISVYVIRKMAKEMKRDHKLAAELWKTKKHEARLLAIFIDEPEKVTEAQMERWAKDFNSWDLCDLCCANLFDRTPYAYKKAAQWAQGALTDLKQRSRRLLFPKINLGGVSNRRSQNNDGISKRAGRMSKGRDKHRNFADIYEEVARARKEEKRKMREMR